MRIRRQAGFTYLGLVILVTVIGLVGAATLKIDALLRRAAAEEELLSVGAAFGAALASYAAATPRGQPTVPPSLQELLKDPRTPGLRRHLRKIFVDPATGSTEWGIVYQAGQSGVVAVYSLSPAQPLKIGNFSARFSGFENKQHLSDWKFTAGVSVPVLATAQAPLVAPAAPAPPPLVPAAVAPPPPAEEKAEATPEEKKEEEEEEGDATPPEPKT